MEIDDLADTRDTVDTVVAEFENLDSRVGQTDFSNLRSWSEPSTASAAAHFDGTEASDSRIPLHKRKWSTGVAAVDASARKQMKAESTSAMESADRVMTDDGETSEEIVVSDEDQYRAHDWIHSFKAMSLTQQSFAIQSLVRALSDPQIRSMRHLIEPLFQKDFLSQLPEEIAFHIIAYLTPCDLTACAGVSRTWQRLCEDDRTWRRKCLENGYVKPDAPSFRFLGGWAANRANEQAGITIFSHMDLQEAHQNRREREIAYGQCYERSLWKSLYLRKKRIISNWRSRAIQSSTVLKGHDEHVITCLQIHSGRIVTGSDDNTLRVWNVDDAQPAFTLTGHMGGVWTSQVSDDGKYIVSGSTDRTVRVWCGQTGVQRHVLQGHTSTVRCMSLHGTTLVSGSRDQTLRVWDIVDGKCLHILAGHLAAVRCVQFDGKRVVSGAYDFTVKIWNVHTKECLHTLTGHTNRVYSLLFEPERDLVVSGSLDTTIRVWDVRRGTCIALLQGHQSLTSGMQLRGNILVSCNADSDVRVWDIRDGGSCTHRLQGANGHTSAITSLQLLDSGLLATSSDDGSVKLWDVDKGVFVRDLVRLQSGGSGGCIWRLKATETLLVCAVGSRNGTEDTKLILIDFDASYP